MKSRTIHSFFHEYDMDISESGWMGLIFNRSVSQLWYFQFTRLNLQFYFETFELQNDRLQFVGQSRH